MAMRTTAVLDRLIHDDDLHDQLTTGADRLLAAYRSLVAVGRRLAGKPEPEPRRRRRLPVLVIGVGVLALVRSMHRAQQSPAAPAG